MSCTIIMEAYDVFLMGNFLALPAFTKDYGVWNELKQEYVVAPAWQSAIQVAGQLGALIGVFIAGPLTSRIGYRYATLTGLMLLNVFIFSFYFANSLPGKSKQKARQKHREKNPGKKNLPKHPSDSLLASICSQNADNRYSSHVRCSNTRGHSLGHLHCQRTSL